MTVHDPATNQDYPKQSPVTHEQLERRLNWEINRRDKKFGARQSAAVFGYIILAAGFVFAVGRTNDLASTAKDLSTHTRTVQCRHSVELDQSRYETYKEGKINAATLQRFLIAEAKYRTELAPAPECTGKISPPVL